ncbi:hypothetical protein AAU61_05185 [Desulfocarbo indianensis]|nr:hypothetical protein AAU61_05185 [Desulfocarbo indianensis]
MKAVAMDWDAASQPNLAIKQNKTSAAAGLFAELFAHFSQQSLTQPAAVASAQSSGSGSLLAAQSTTSQSQDQTNSPIQSLKASLEETGQPLERFQVAAEDRDKLKNVLVMSGYSQEDAQEMIQRASQDDGTVNLGALFGVMPQYEADQGPVFLLNAEDKTLLAQLLKDLGLPDNEVRSYLDSLAKQGDNLIVSGLPQMMARALELQQVRDGATEVDQDKLRDLLARIGLSSQEINTLLNKSLDGQGRLNPEACLALLEKAAASQDQRVKTSLQELAQKIQVNDGTNGQASDAERLKTQVMQFLQKTEVQANPEAKQEFAQTLKDFMQADAASKTTDLTSEETARLVKEQSGLATARSGDQGKSEGQAQDQSQQQSQAQAGEAGFKALAAQSAKSSSQGGQNFTETLNASSAADGRLAQAGKAAAAQRTLPTYVVRQVSEQIAQMAKSSQNQLRLALKPQELGELTIKLSIKEGALKATLVAESSSAKQTLEAGINELKQQLAQQGLKVERLEVVMSPDAERREAKSGEQDSSGQGGDGSESGGSGGSQSEDEEISVSAPGLASLSGRVNVFA